MKIGILSMYYRRNYGGVLQSYALCKVLHNLGYEVKVIDYRGNGSISSYHLIYVLRFLYKKIYSSLFSKRNDSVVKTKPLSDDVLKAFADFKNQYLDYTLPVSLHNLSTAIGGFDAVVFGSDQIWNSMNRKQLVYFGDFRTNVQCRKIAYAPCSIYSKPPGYNKTKLRNLLHGFKALSARDATTAQLVNDIIGETPPIVADPTVLHDFKEFTFPAIRNEKYIFAYILGSEISGGHQGALDKIFAKIGKMKVIAIVVSDVSLEAEKFADEILYTASPADWVNLVANAQYVYTDSFHGTMFAMKFHVPFMAYYKDASRASRLLDIRHTYNIPSIVSSAEEFDANRFVNFSEVDAKLGDLRKFSIEYLNDALK